MNKVLLGAIISASLILPACGGEGIGITNSATDGSEASIAESNPAAVTTIESDDFESDASSESTTGPSAPSEIQAGTLTAGDYDDQLNPALYQQYISDFLQSNQNSGLPFVDLNQRITLQVIDSDGLLFHNAYVTVTDVEPEGTLPTIKTREYKTNAEGIVYIYPQLDGFLYDALAVRITTSPNGNTEAEQVLQLANLPDDRKITFYIASPQPASSTLDLMLVIDTTGSMGDELDYLKIELDAILDTISADNTQVDIRVGLVVYRDYGDAYLLKDFEFTDKDSLQDTLSQQEHNGGGDFPEAMDVALKTALAHEWRENSTKILLLVADAPPHQEDISATWDSALNARARGIHIVPVAASGVDSSAEFLMRGMAALTQSRYIFLTDDSGVGNAHAEPSLDCYLVTRLDRKIVNVINSLIDGERQEPEAENIIRSHGNYNLGVCENDTPEDIRTLDVSSGTVNAIEVSSYFSPYLYDITQKFYHFEEQNTVLRLRFPNQSSDFTFTAEVNLFDGNAADEDIYSWITNKLSDAQSVGAAEPIAVAAIDATSLSISTYIFQDAEAGGSGDEYDNYTVNFIIDAVTANGLFSLESFDDAVTVHVLTKDFN